MPAASCRQLLNESLTAADACAHVSARHTGGGQLYDCSHAESERQRWKEVVERPWDSHRAGG